MQQIEYIHIINICNKSFNMLKPFLTDWKDKQKTKDIYTMS